MLASVPYTTWPLHVTFFTEEAERTWRVVNTELENDYTLPAGFTTCTQLEGVDGKTGASGSGRTGPIDVTDGELHEHSSQGYGLIFSKRLLLQHIWTNLLLCGR
jgi:hypothetical protein